MSGFMTNWGSQFSPPPVFSTPGYAPGGTFGASWNGSSSGYDPGSYTAMGGGTGGIGSGVGAGAATSGGGSGLGFNTGTAQLALSGLATIGNLWAAFQAQKLAREQFNYTKNVTDTNLTNQIKTYNTSLTDRANNRAIVEGRDSAYTQNYIDTNSLKRYGS